MRAHSFGAETVPVAMVSNLVVGSVLEKNYKLTLAGINGEDVIETRFLAGKNDWEGRA